MLNSRVWLVAVVLAVSCGGAKNPLAPDSGMPGPSGATVTILATGSVDQKQVTIAVGQSVTFVNNDSRAHDMASNPHPQHSDCPSLRPIGGLPAGQSRLTNAITQAVTCGYHDHSDPTNAALQGQIIVR